MRQIEVECDTETVPVILPKIERGELVAVVGPSGCGKSTLMKLVTGLHLPQKGTVTVAGQRVVKPIAIVGMAFQNPTMLPWRTTLENILLPLEIVEKHRRRLRSHKAEYVAKAEALLETVGLKGFGAKFPWQLSGGMQQRANLCRALIHEPELLMLDEPFAALDAFTREELWCIIRDLHASQDVTIVLVTHDLRESVFLVIWFGIGTVPAVLTAFLISFFPIVVNVATGLATIEPETEDVLRALGARKLDIMLKVGIPRSMPYFFGSLKIAITLAFVGSVVSETVASNNGLGNMMASAQSQFNVPLVFAGLMMLAVEGIVMYALMAWIEKRVTGWAHRSTMAN
jgi:ABC-type nitrate/sulfonate/bicarbonate transport system ATPase subunit